MTTATPAVNVSNETNAACVWDFEIRDYNIDQKELTARIRTACKEELIVNYDRARTYRYCPHCGKELKWNGA